MKTVPPTSWQPRRSPSRAPYGEHVGHRWRVAGHPYPHTRRPPLGKRRGPGGIDMKIDDQPAWWGVERDDLVADLSGVLCMVALGMDEGLPAPISVDTRPWTVEMIIQVTPSH